MKISRKRCVIVIVVVFVTFVMLYMQMRRDVEVIGNYILRSENGYEENITIVANKIYITDQEKMAKDLVERCVENSFHEIRFSYDLQGYPNGLHITVYTNNITYKLGVVAFELLYIQKNGEIYEYNIKDNPEKFSLKIL